MQLRWEGFKKVRGQVCKRIKKRLHRLNLDNYFQYRNYLENNPDEWEELEPLTHISISRFFRDKRSWEVLGDRILPELAERARQEGRALRCWSAGCASGEEPYSFIMLWDRKVAHKFPGLPLDIIATDADNHLLKRAGRAGYTAGSLKNVPEEWVNKYFDKTDSVYHLMEEYRDRVRLEKQDIKETMPRGNFDIIFCKNLAGMYFEKDLAVKIFKKISRKMNKGGYLLLGNHEEFPEEAADNVGIYNKGTHIYRKE